MKQLIVIIALLFSFVAQGEVHNCIPENTRKNPISYTKSTTRINTVTEEVFNSTIENAKEVYAPIFKDQYGAELVIVADWEDATVNAYAQQSGKNWKVHMFGGLARDPLITRDGFLGVICHEIGHHIAGAPRKGLSWASNEGQSDYFATSKCLKKIFEKDIQNTSRFYVRPLAGLTEEQKIARKACQEVYKTHNERAICFRSALAGESLAKLLGSLGGNADVKFSTPDPAVVIKTNHNHPKGQCRMDSYFQGALCDVDHIVWPDAKDAAMGYCTSKDKFEIGLRPLCWFKPSEYDLER